MSNTPGILLVSGEKTFPEDTFKMGVFESIVQQVTGIKITHEFVKPGEAGIEDASRWGFRVKAALPNTVFRSLVQPLKLANGLRTALKAGGADGDKAVRCTEQGVWVDGRAIAEFVDSLCKVERPQVDEERLRSESAARGLKLEAQPMHRVEIDWNLPAAKALLDSLRNADFSKDGHKR